MPRRRVIAARGSLAAAAVLVATTLTSAQAGSGSATPPCVTVAATPTFATDRILFCGTGTAWLHGAEEQPLDVYRSEDAGRTWKGPFRVAAPQLGDAAVSAIFVSPLFATDGTVFVSTGTTAYVSTDRGETYTLLGSGYLFNYDSTSIHVAELPGGALPRAALVTIPAASFTGPCCAYLFDSLTPGVARPLPPNLADWAYARHYLVPPDLGAGRTPVMIGRPGVRSDSAIGIWSPHVKAYACDAAFNCTREIYDFAPVAEETETWVRFTGGTYAASPHKYVLTYSSPERPSLRLFHSLDHGQTWTPWESASRLLAGLRWHAHVSVVASPDTPKQLFVFIAGDEAAPGHVPEQRVFRSDDNGATWRSAGHAWGPTQKARSRSTLPWNSTGYAYQPPVVGPNGWLYVPAARRTGALGKYTTRVTVYLFCSRDYGRSWSKRC